MMRKKHLVKIAALLFVCAVWAGCDNADAKLTKEEAFAELDGFTVSESASAEMGESFAVPVVIAFDADGVEYTALSAVETDGRAVEVKNGEFLVEWEKDYVITYTLTYQGYTFTKNMTVRPADTVCPLVTIEEDFSKHPVGEQITLPLIKATDQGGSGVVSAEVEITTPSGEKSKIEGTTFTPEEAGKYLLTVTAKDKFGNTATQSSWFFASGAKKEYEELENFEEGFNSSFIQSNSLKFSLVAEENNIYLSSGVSEMWPWFSVDKKAVAEYMEKGYDALSFSVWGTHTDEFQLYFERAEGEYIRFNILPDAVNKISLSAADVQSISEHGGGC